MGGGEEGFGEFSSSFPFEGHLFLLFPSLPSLLLSLLFSFFLLFLAVETLSCWGSFFDWRRYGGKDFPFCELRLGQGRGIPLFCNRSLVFSNFRLSVLGAITFIVWPTRRRSSIILTTSLIGGLRAENSSNSLFVGRIFSLLFLLSSISSISMGIIKDSGRENVSRAFL